MQGDLSDSRAAIAWGESQLPILAGRIRSWEADGLKVVPIDPNPQSDKKLAIVRIEQPLPDIIHAEVGVIIGSFRSSLDLLGATLALRRGIIPNREHHFPIFRSLYDFIDPLDGIENKKWLSPTDIKIIKALRPYNGGNDLLWSLHQLDILRKHERLIAAIFSIHSFAVFGRGIQFHIRDFSDLKDETVLFEFPRNEPQPKVQLSIEIIFDEVGLSVYREPLLVTLVDFAHMATGIVDSFDI